MEKISMRELAKVLNVSVATVSKALSDSHEISRSTKEKVWETLTIQGRVKLWQYGSELITNWEMRSAIRFTTN